MDGGQNEQSVANGIKNIVQYTSRRKKGAAAPKTTRNARLAPRLENSQGAKSAASKNTNVYDNSVTNSMEMV